MIEKKEYLNLAYNQAKLALKHDEVPVGAIIVKDGIVIAKAYNKKETKNDVTAHAEIEAIRKASKVLNTWHLDGCDMYVTLEPCAMCASAILQSRIANVFYGAVDLKGGAIESTMKMYEIKGFNHYPNSFYLKSNKCSKILSSYFKNKR